MGIAAALSTLGDLVATEQCGLDLERSDSVREWIRRHQPAVIVNAAAYTAVDQAESEPEKMRRINTEAVGVLAEEASRINAWLLHYSTDYVFDGMKSAPYVENDEARPLSVYGRTKWEGEEALRVWNPKHFNFRTSWGFASRGRNFARTIVRLAKEKETLSVIADQWGAPTGAELLADVTAVALYRALSVEQNERLSGTYHLVAAGETNWHKYAQYVLTLANQHGVVLKTAPEAVIPILTEAYPVQTQRPRNSRLDVSKVTKTFGIHLPDWRIHVRRCLDELAAQGAL